MDMLITKSQDSGIDGLLHRLLQHPKAHNARLALPACLCVKKSVRCMNMS